MKTIKEIEAEIGELKKAIMETECVPGKKAENMGKKLRARLVLLRGYIAFLESDPDEIAQKRKMETLEVKIKHIRIGVNKTIGSGYAAKEALKMSGVPKLLAYVDRINYLLK